ncbi:MAG: hypothetical protein SOZ08_08500 [Erysipelotrichaceae bacterium]|nr:hypothetical protein [Erysipelotrichaceae bacterium]
MLYPYFGILFAAADCLPDPEYDHDFHASSRLWLSLLLQLAFPDILFVVIFLLLIIRCLHKDPMTLHLPGGKGTSGESYSFWLWICLPSISCGRLPWISHLFFIHPLSKSQSLTLMFPQAMKTIMTTFPERMKMAVLTHSTCLHSSIMPARAPVNQKKML